MTTKSHNSGKPHTKPLVFYRLGTKKAPQSIGLQRIALVMSPYLVLLKVPRPGVEPGRVAPLVFETSASTDSAIWASKAGAKIRSFF